MSARKLTDSFIKNHPKPDKRIEIYDKHVKGLAVRVTPAGSKSFVYRYRFGKNVKRFTIGAYPKFSLSQARKIAKDELAPKIALGHDPLDEKQKQKKKKKLKHTTFKELADKFKEIHCVSLREKTKEEYRRIIKNELNSFNNLPAQEITHTKIIELLDVKAIKMDSPTMANRIRARLHSIYEFGISRGIVTANPVATVPKYPEGETRRERYYSEGEIRHLWAQFEKQGEPVQSVLKMLLICGQRSKETRHMKWKDIQDNVWTIPAELSKSKRSHDVPLPDLAIQILNDLQPITGNSEYVFESPKLKGQPVEWIKRPVKEVREASKVTDFRLHDLRRTMATYLAKLAVDRTILGKLLNHKGLAGDGQVTAIYDRHSYLDEKRNALMKWSHHLQQIITNESKAKIHKIG